MIEYMATALSVAYVWAGMIWIDKRQKRFAALAIALGLLAMTVKVTSAVFWMVPLLLYWSRGPRLPLRVWLRERLNISLVLFAIPLIACVLWTQHADDIKASSPATTWLTSEALVNWNFGTIAERMSVHAWTLIAQRDFLAPIYTNRVADPETVLPQAREIDAETNAQDLIVFDGLNWSPAVPYYARRRGMMIEHDNVSTRLLNALPGQGYTYLYTAPQDVRFSAIAREVLERWEWFGEVDPHIFRLGATCTSVYSAEIAATATSFQPPAGSVSLIAAPKLMSCDGLTTDIAAAVGDVITLQFASVSPAADDSLAVNGQWIPADSTVVVESEDDPAGSLRLACEGDTALDLAGVYGRP